MGSTDSQALSLLLLLESAGVSGVFGVFGVFDVFFLEQLNFGEGAGIWSWLLSSEVQESVQADT